MIKRLFFLLVAVALVFAGCETMTIVTIQTDTPDAKVYIDGNYVGDTSGSSGNASFQFSAINKSNTTVKIEKDDKFVTSTLFTELKVINLVGGFLLLLVPFIWVVGPIPVQTINLL